MPMNKTTLGKAMHQAILSVQADQSSPRDGSVGEKRCIAMAEAIIEHIKGNATIAVLPTTSTPAGTGPHIHDPQTIESTAKIS